MTQGPTAAMIELPMPSDTTPAPNHPDALRRPGRAITGMSAILLPFTTDGDIDWDGLAAHIARTAEAGLWPAVNMDTGYVQLLDEATQDRVLDVAAEHGGGRFVAGAFVADEPGDPLDLAAYRRRAEAIAGRGGTPVIFPSYGLSALDGTGWVGAHAVLAESCEQLIAFELGEMFVPYGRIYDLDTYAGLMEVPACIGAKHSSLERQPEWDRLARRDQVRPDFLVLTGNDLAIDMVMYGSDYLLGLSTFAPDLFARRDEAWRAGDDAFHEMNDVLQHLGQLTFRPPVPGYRHDAAMFLQLRGWIASDAIPGGAVARPESDREILRDIVARVESLLP